MKKIVSKSTLSFIMHNKQLFYVTILIDSSVQALDVFLILFQSYWHCGLGIHRL